MTPGGRRGDRDVTWRMTGGRNGERRRSARSRRRDPRLSGRDRHGAEPRPLNTLRRAACLMEKQRQKQAGPVRAAAGPGAPAERRGHATGTPAASRQEAFDILSPFNAHRPQDGGGDSDSRIMNNSSIASSIDVHFFLPLASSRPNIVSHSLWEPNS